MGADSLVSLLVQSRTIGRFIGSIQSEMSIKGKEVSTGKKDDLVSELGGEIRNYLDLKSVHTSLNNRKERLQTADNRLSQMGIMMETISSQAKDFNPLMSQIGIIDRNNIRVYSEQAKSMIEATQNALNVQWGGRYLFSGDEVLQPSIQGLSDMVGVVEDVINTHVADAGGALSTQEQVDAMMEEINSIFENTHDTYNFDEICYTGGSGDMAGIEMGERDVMSFGLKANDPEIRKLVQGLSMVAASDTIQAAFGDETKNSTNSLEDSYLRTATSLIANGERNLIGVQSSLGFKQQRIGNTMEGMEQTIFHYEERIGLFENADQYEAGIAFSELQRQLEASYYVTAKISEQSLMNYLR